MRRFGYGPLDGPGKGLDLFIDPGLRRDVFLKIFPDPIAGEVRNRPEMQPPLYPFPSCDRNPFPSAFRPGGEPAESDPVCGIQP